MTKWQMSNYHMMTFLSISYTTYGLEGKSLLSHIPVLEVNNIISPAPPVYVQNIVNLREVGSLSHA